MKISDLVIGQTYDLTLVVKSASARETKAKKPYLALEFFDGTDIITGNYWDWTSGNVPAVNSIVDINAQVGEWAGAKQLTVKAMKANTTKHLAEFAPTSTVDIAATYNKAYSMACAIKDDALRDLTLSILDKLQDAWLTVPGAVSVHHAYIGGTLIHSVSVASIAAAIASEVPEANMDLCVAGGLLHDIGKLYTYKLNGVSIEMTDIGKLYDHIFIGAEFVGNFAEELGLNNDYQNACKIGMLRHIILSHHGSLEYGSPVYPASIEAHIVHAADGVDAITEQIRVASRKVSDNVKWTDRLYTLNNKNQLTPAYVNYVMNYVEAE